MISAQDVVAYAEAQRTEGVGDFIERRFELELENASLRVDRALAKNRRDHRIQLTSVEVKLFREQYLVRAKGTRLVFPTITGRSWTRSGFRERVWIPALDAAEREAEENERGPSQYAGLTFHLLRHTAGSLMALAGMEPPVAAECLGHTDGGALFLKTYRHLYEHERKRQVAKLGRLVERELRKAADQS